LGNTSKKKKEKPIIQEHITLEDPKLQCTANFYNAFASIGKPPWSDEHLGKLLAWASATGFRECTVVRPLHDVLMVAAARFGIQGGRRPNVELMQKYYDPRLKEIKALKAETPWLPALMERYKVEGWQNYDFGW
jgi:hypothetical protein